MNFAYKTPDGAGIYKVVLNQPLEDQSKTIEEANLWPVDPTIPAGKMQDFSAGTNGWFVDGDTVRPCLVNIPPKTVEQARNDKIFTLGISASQAEQNGITVGGVTLSATDTSLIKIIGLMVFMDRASAAGLLNINDNVTVHDINDTPVVLPVAQMNSLLLGFGSQYISGFSTRKSKLNAIKAATTVEQIEAIE